MLVHKDSLIALYGHFLQGACFFRNFEHVLRKKSILPSIRKFLIFFAVNYFCWKFYVMRFHKRNCSHMKIWQPSLYEIRITRTSMSICQKQVNKRQIFDVFKAGWLPYKIFHFVRFTIAKHCFIAYICSALKFPKKIKLS